MLMMLPFLALIISRPKTCDVEVHHLLPAVERHLLGRRDPGAAGVVDENVDAPEFLEGLRLDRLNLLRFRYIGRDRQRLHAELFQLVGGLLAVFQLARAHDDVRPGLGEALRHLQPEPGRAPRHDAHAAVQIHQFPHRCHFTPKTRSATENTEITEKAP
jgi:hypothetical protein